MSLGLSNAGFDIDLSDGLAREGALRNVLDWAKVEVKDNKKGVFTGNFFLEYRQKGRPSGIAITTAEYWAIEYERNHWVILPTEKLKRIGRFYYKDPAMRRQGGDYNRYDGVLIPVVALVGIGIFALGSAEMKITVPMIKDESV